MRAGAPRSGIIATADDLEAALERLAWRDPRLGAALAKVRQTGLEVPLRREPAGLESLLRLIVFQMISLKAAAAIWARLEGAGLIEPPAILAAGREGLAACGLSRAKANAFAALADMAREGALGLDGLDALDDRGALGALVRLPGVGRWTGELYLLQCLGRADVFPAGDIALRSAMMRALALPVRPTLREADALAEVWSPDRAVAARLLWALYRLPD